MSRTKYLFPARQTRARHMLASLWPSLTGRDGDAALVGAGTTAGLARGFSCTYCGCPISQLTGIQYGLWPDVGSLDVRHPDDAQDALGRIERFAGSKRGLDMTSALPRLPRVGLAISDAGLPLAVNVGSVRGGTHSADVVSLVGLMVTLSVSPALRQRRPFALRLPWPAGGPSGDRRLPLLAQGSPLQGCVPPAGSTCASLKMLLASRNLAQVPKESRRPPSLPAWWT